MTVLHLEQNKDVNGTNSQSLALGRSERAGALATREADAAFEWSLVLLLLLLLRRLVFFLHRL